MNDVAWSNERPRFDDDVGKLLVEHLVLRAVSHLYRDG